VKIVFNNIRRRLHVFPSREAGSENANCAIEGREPSARGGAGEGVQSPWPGAKLSREPGSMAYDFALAVRPRANNHRVVRCVGNVPVSPLPTCYFRFLSTIYSANRWRLPHKHDRREKMTLFAKWAKLWIRTPAKVAT
jgi:hypothetical protein